VFFSGPTFWDFLSRVGHSILAWVLAGGDFWAGGGSSFFGQSHWLERLRAYGPSWDHLIPPGWIFPPVSFDSMPGTGEDGLFPFFREQLSVAGLFPSCFLFVFFRSEGQLVLIGWSTPRFGASVFFLKSWFPSLFSERVRRLKGTLYLSFSPTH